MNRDLKRDHNGLGPDSFIATAGVKVMYKQQQMNEWPKQLSSRTSFSLELQLELVSIYLQPLV